MAVGQETADDEYLQGAHTDCKRMQLVERGGLRSSEVRQVIQRAPENSVRLKSHMCMNVDLAAIEGKEGRRDYSAFLASFLNCDCLIYAVGQSPAREETFLLRGILTIRRLEVFTCVRVLNIKCDLVVMCGPATQHLLSRV